MKNKLLSLLLSFSLSALGVSAQSAADRTISSDVSKVLKPKSEMYFKCVGAGRAAEGLRGDWQRQLTMLQKDAPFEYIRFHGLFHDDMGVYTETDEGKSVYNFQYIDELYDFLLSVNIKPFVEMSFMPKAMSSGDQTVFWWKGNVTPPKSYDAWADLVAAFTQHVTDRYGRDEVKTWYFEVWNEPNHPAFFSGKQAEYFEMYKRAANAVRSVDKEYRVGGPATAGCGWVSDFVKYCQNNNVPVDFVSTHTYGVYGALDEFGKKQLRIISNPNVVSSPVNRVRSNINSLGGKDLELHFTEWSSSYSPRDLTHDTYMNAPYVLNTLRHVKDDVQSMSYWTFTDIFEESGIPTEPFHGGFGLITMSDLKKPTYFTYVYLNQLGQQELVNSDENSWVCKDEEGNIQVLAYDISIPKLAKYDYNNRIFSEIRVPALKNTLNVNLTNIPKGRYDVEIYKTGYRKNDIQTIYFDMGKPHNLSPEQREELAKHTQNLPEKVERVKIKDGNYSIQLPLYENDIYFIKLVAIK